MPDAQFIELLDHIGIEPSHLRAENGEHTENPKAGELAPLSSEACAFAVPTAVGKEIVQTTRHVQIRPSDTPVAEKPAALQLDDEVTTAARIIPGTRQIETRDPAIAQALCSPGGGYQPVDPPKSQHVARGRNAKGEEE